MVRPRLIIFTESTPYKNNLFQELEPKLCRGIFKSIAETDVRIIFVEPMNKVWLISDIYTYCSSLLLAMNPIRSLPRLCYLNHCYYSIQRPNKYNWIIFKFFKSCHRFIFLNAVKEKKKGFATINLYISFIPFIKLTNLAINPQNSKQIRLKNN
ncbi:MAG: hypothetical protein J6Y78_18210 [Paludibacteraceae bacterium]|nr:hypothetical protein [Paludibacteraceae bacterium]